MKFLPDFRIGKWEFEAKKEDPGVLITIILVLFIGGAALLWINGDPPNVDHVETHHEAHD